MLKLTRKIIKGIETGDEESFLGAEEVAVFLSHGLDNSGIVEPYYTELNAEPATEEDGDALQTALTKYLEKTGQDADPAAIWALGKYQNSKNVEILKKQLSLHLDKTLRHSKGLFNALDGLKKSGEESISRASYGVTTLEDNIQDARIYLAELGEVHPW